MTATGIGASVRRKEDQRFITGKGHYTDDINRPGQAYAIFLRSPHAHATIRSIDTAAAKAMPGVLAVLTGEDLAADKVGGLICGWMIHSKDGTPMKAGPHPALAQGKVRYVGDHVAVVVAETLAQAQGRGRGHRRRLRGAAGGRRRRRGADAGRPQIHEVAPDNTVFRWHLGDKAAVDAGLRHGQARHQARHRQQPAGPERDRAARRDRRVRSGQRAATRSTPRARTRMWRGSCSRPSSASRPSTSCASIAPDVGGGFGSKIFIYAEETVCLWAAKKVGRPVKWNGDRTEAFLCRRARPRPRHPCRDGDRRGRQDPRRCGSRPSPISAPISRPSPPRCRPISTRRCCPASTTSRRSIARSTASTPTRRRSTPIAAPDGRRRPSWSSAWSRSRRARLGMDPAKFRRKQLHQEVPAPDAGDHDLRRRRLSGLARKGAGACRLQRLRARASARAPATASCAASASPPISRPAASPPRRRSARSAPASACGNWPRCGSIRPARSRS